MIERFKKMVMITDIKACGISNQRETFVVWDEGENHYTMR